MIIHKMIIDPDHWSTEWIPISYNQLSAANLARSYTFLWSSDYTVNALCRAYYINSKRVELGDVWVNEKYRGQYIDGVKVSYAFLSKVIDKIFHLFPNIRQITLVVFKDNPAAYKLYLKLGFTTLS